MKNKLLYELELELNETRQKYVNKVKNNILTIEELFDLGFNNAYIVFDEDNYNLGYKWVSGESFGYDSEDFVITDDILKSKVEFFDLEYGDYGYDIYVELVNKEDAKYFNVNGDSEVE